MKGRIYENCDIAFYEKCEIQFYENSETASF